MVPWNIANFLSNYSQCADAVFVFRFKCARNLVITLCKVLIVAIAVVEFDVLSLMQYLNHAFYELTAVKFLKQVNLCALNVVLMRHKKSVNKRFIFILFRIFASSNFDYFVIFLWKYIKILLLLAKLKTNAVTNKYI